MTQNEITPDPATVNTRPGQTDEGGHGGMATREQEARLLAAEQSDENADNAPDDRTDEER